MADRSEELFQSIETIAKGLISDLKFNKTVICTIKDNKDAKDGKYYVTDGTSNFYAFCENTDYLIDQSVYVLIPNGDYGNQKIITGKYLADNNDVYIYKSPWESFVDITNNLYNNATDISAQNHSSLIANGLTKEIQLWENDNLALKGYTTIGIKADFKTLLSDLNVGSGHYGIRIKIRFINDTTSQKKASSIIRQIEFTNDDMYGNTYNFETFYTQSKIFTIQEPNKVIDKIWVTFFQDADFRSVSGIAVPAAATDNIFVQNVYLAFGYDLNSFDSDQVLLYTLNSSTYDATSTVNENTKVLNLRWVHKLEDGNLQCYAEETEESSSQMIIHWYKYNLATGVQDDLAGNFWEEIQSAKNKFQYVIQPDTTKAEEKYKVIIESPIVSELLKSINDTELNTAQSNLAQALEIYNDMQAIYAGLTDEDSQAILKTYSDAYDEALEAYELVASKYSIEAQYYESNVLSLLNESMVANYASIDLVEGLKIECDLDGYNGIYTIYNSANELQNSSEAGTMRLLTAVFDSIITGQESLDTAEKITWRIPLIRTMIQKPIEGKEYNLSNGDDYYESSDGTYCLITRDGMKATGEIGSSFPNAADQYFRIKPYLVEQATNNTITCYVTKNNLTYSASVTLAFGTSGNNGTDYTFILQWEEGNNCIYSDKAYLDANFSDDSDKPIRIDAHLFDENNNELTLNTVNFSWLNPGLDSTFENSAITFCDANGITLIKNNKPVLEYNGSGYCYIHYDGTYNKTNAFYHILKAEVTTETEDVKSNGEPLGYKVILTAYLPIPLCEKITITDFEGCSKILYSSLGTNPTYYTGAYRLFEGMNEISSTSWTINIKDSEISTLQPGDMDITNYYPRVEESDGYYYPIIPSMYFSATGICCVIGKINNINTWIQPILIQLDHYQSSLLNSWDGSFSIDEETGTIMSTMLAAGRKDSRNRFSGVLVGDINEEDEGVFGYHEGDQSFGFRTNGQAFIGKAGKGRIEFDGNSGQIKSMSYQEGITSLNLMTGMKIDLDDGVIEMHGVTSNAIEDSDFRENPLSSTAINNSDFRRHGEYELTSSAAYQPSHSLVKMSALSPYFYVAKADNGNNKMIPLFQIGDKESFIQTLDYREGEQTGARITLSDLSGDLNYDANGNIQVLDSSGNSKLKQSSFEIKAYSPDGGVKISSASPFLWAGAYSSSSVGKPSKLTTVLQVGSTASYIQTVDYDSSKKTGARITLGLSTTPGTPSEALDSTATDGSAVPSFDIKAYSTDGGIKLSSISPFLQAEALPSNGSNRVTVLEVGSTSTYIQTVDYDSSKKTGARITLKGALDSQGSTKPSFDIKAYSDTGGVKISSVSPYFVAQTRDNSHDIGGIKDLENYPYKTLMNVGNQSFYLQSANYTPPSNSSMYSTAILDGEIVYEDLSESPTSTAVATSTAITGGKGMRIDLSNGKIIGYDFALKAQSSKGDAWDGSYVSINSNGNSFLKVHLTANKTYKIKRFSNSNSMGEETGGSLSGLYVYNETTNSYIRASGTWDENETYYEEKTGARDLDLLNIGKNKFILQSQDWDPRGTPPTGTQINLTGGKITSYNFNLKAMGDKGKILMSSGNSIYPFRIEGSEDFGTNPTHGARGTGYFRIKWSGAFSVGNSRSHLSFEDGEFELKNATIDNGFFFADEDKARLGQWHVTSERGALYYGSSQDPTAAWNNSPIGFTGNLDDQGQLYIWAGYSGSEGNASVFLVNDTQVYAKELKAGYTVNTSLMLDVTNSDVAVGKVRDSIYYTDTLGQDLNTIYDSIWNDWSWLIKRQSHGGTHNYCRHEMNE